MVISHPGRRWFAPGLRCLVSQRYDDLYHLWYQLLIPIACFIIITMFITIAINIITIITTIVIITISISGCLPLFTYVLS